MTSAPPAIILASKSAGRKQLLQKAGIAFEAQPADIDEDAIKTGMAREGAAPEAIAAALAAEKARKISARYPRRTVLGSDQILVAPGGALLGKVASADAAKSQIAKLAGREHRLISAAAIVEDGELLWQATDTARLHMRALSPEDISQYVARYWNVIRHCVGCYRIEAEGRALFENISGAQSTIIGMPMSPLLDYLKSRGYEPTG